MAIDFVCEIYYLNTYGFTYIFEVNEANMTVIISHPFGSHINRC